METVEVADLVGSATEVALTLKFPVAVPAVKSPEAEIVPPVALHVTAVLVVPVTEAVNCCAWPGWSIAEDGDSVNCTGGAGIVTAAVADLVGSAAEVAFTLKLPAARPALNRPVDEIVPPV